MSQLFFIKTNTNTLRSISLIFLGLFLSLVFFGNVTLASVVNLDKIVNTKDPDKLDKYKDKVEKQLKTTTQQKNILTSQVKLYDLKVSKTKRTLANIEKEYKRNELELKKLQKELAEKDTEIATLKKQLKEAVLIYEKNKQDFKIKALSSDSDITFLMSKSGYLRKIFTQIKEKVDTIKEDKNIIENKKSKIEESREKINENKKELKEQKDALESQKRVKNDFLKKTQ